MNIRKITPDKEKAKNLLNNAEIFLKTLELIRGKTEAAALINLEYDLLHNITGALLAYDGEKVEGEEHHKNMIIRVSEKYNLSKAQMAVFDELRKIRNDINYYGQKDKETLEDYYRRNKETIAMIREMLLINIKEKLR